MKQALFHFHSKDSFKDSTSLTDFSGSKRPCVSPLLSRPAKPCEITQKDVINTEKIDSKLINSPEKREETVEKEKKRTNVYRLSQKTVELLKEMHIPDRPTPRVEEILTSVPASEKHLGLLTNPRHLPLPCDYQRLLTLFSTCDAVLTFLKRRHSEATFPCIRRDVETTCGLQFNEQRLQQLMTVLPNAYELHWVKDMEKGFILVLDFPLFQGQKLRELPQSELTRRKNVVYRELMTRTKECHFSFLQSLPERPQIHPERMRSWYHGFDLHSVPSIPATPLPAKPVNEAWESIKDFLNSHQTDIKNITEKPENRNKSLLSDAILSQVRQYSEPTSESIRLDQYRYNLLSLCEILTSIYATHHAPSLFVSSLVTRVGHLMQLDSGMVKRLIEELVGEFPYWLRLLQTSTGQVLRINRMCELSLATIRSTLLSRYASS